jgi:hypothetical protein
MSKRYFVADTITDDGKYRVLQEDTETGEPFGVQDFDTLEEAQNVAEGLQKAITNVLSERITGDLPDLPISVEENTDVVNDDKYKDTLQDLKNETSQD